mmetsp:Transcript_51918/g.83859  ORF Transcript_51918/g.83859 Transcript_51918/m.83859 type:complete len:83 (-) Transcript_51918:94-342(-)
MRFSDYLSGWRPFGARGQWHVGSRICAGIKRGVFLRVTRFDEIQTSENLCVSFWFAFFWFVGRMARGVQKTHWNEKRTLFDG